MRVLLVSANTEKINMAVLPLGLACVAAATQKAGHKTKVLNLIDLVQTAAKEGLIAPDENLLFPKFYIKKDLEDWLRKTIGVWRKDRPHWLA